jgi:hypothetical protein
MKVNDRFMSKEIFLLQKKIGNWIFPFVVCMVLKVSKKVVVVVVAEVSIPI